MAKLLVSPGNVKTISVRLSPNTLDEIGNLVESGKYLSISDAVRGLVKIGLESTV